MNFCEILKYLREEKGVTQKEVALACDLTPTCICQLESGVRNPTGSTIKALAVYFGCSADYLLGFEDELGFYHRRNDFSLEELELLNNYRNSTKEKQNALIVTARSFASESMSKKIKV